MSNLLRGRISCHMRRCRKLSDFEIFQYVFSQKIYCALPVVLLRPLMTITHAISGLIVSEDSKKRIAHDFWKDFEKLIFQGKIPLVSGNQVDEKRPDGRMLF